MKRLIPLLILAMCAPAHAQEVRCGIHVDIEADLAAAFSERRVMAGLNGDGTILEILANAETGTWTALIVRPDGIACLVAAGEQFDPTVAALPADL